MSTKSKSVKSTVPTLTFEPTAETAAILDKAQAEGVDQNRLINECLRLHLVDQQDQESWVMDKEELDQIDWFRCLSIRDNKKGIGFLKNQMFKIEIYGDYNVVYKINLKQAAVVLKEWLVIENFTDCDVMMQDEGFTKFYDLIAKAA